MEKPMLIINIFLTPSFLTRLAQNRAMIPMTNILMVTGREAASPLQARGTPRLLSSMNTGRKAETILKVPNTRKISRRTRCPGMACLFSFALLLIQAALWIRKAIASVDRTQSRSRMTTMDMRTCRCISRIISSTTKVSAPTAATPITFRSPSMIGILTDR